MGRREYLDDLTTAQSIQFENVSSVFSSDDGELTFNFGLEGVKPAQITALIPGNQTEPFSFLLYRAVSLLLATAASYTFGLYKSSTACSLLNQFY